MGEGESRSRIVVREERNKVIIDGVNRDLLVLILLAKIMKLDLRVLLYLYEKFGVDVFFVFFMFAGLQINFPSFTKFYSIIRNIEKMMDGEEVQWKYAERISKEIDQARSLGRVELDFNDRELFPFGREGIIGENE